MSGRVFVVGLGPGAASMRTPQAEAALAASTDLVGYAPYVDRVADRPGLVRHASDNRVERERAEHALLLAASGRVVALVSGGDPGVFAMASALFEAVEHGDPGWRTLDITVVPGVSAMLAAAARIGAPLGGDFCVLSLSDNLKPWELVLRRLAAAAGSGMVLALYNAASQARPWQLGAAFAHLRTLLPDATPVLFATAISRPDEAILVTDLGRADAVTCDMRTLVLIGSAATRRIERPDGGCFLYTTRSVAA